MSGDDPAVPSVSRRDFPGRGLVINLMRAAHLVGVVGVGHVLQSGLPLAAAHGFGILMVGAGIVIVAIDRWSNPEHFRQFNGLAQLAKLALVLALVSVAALGVEVFWGVLVISVLLSHAPGWLRHRRVF